MPELSTETLPLLPLTSGVVLPGMVVTATLETPESRSASSAAQAERLFAVLGPDSRPPDLRGDGLRPDGWEARDLAGHLASVAEYRDPKADPKRARVTLMRWRGELPRDAPSPEEGEDLAAYTWGRHTSYWWRADGVVWCLVGTIPQHQLYEIAEHLGGES